MADVCVIFNPAAARGRAHRGLDALRRRLGERAQFRPTEHPGHGRELARQAAEEGFATIAAAGGDGTVHEVANGLLSANRPDVCFAVCPLGSANDYAYSLQLSSAQHASAGSGQCVRTVDVGRVRGDGGRESYFVNTLGLGFSGAVTIESREIRRLRGLALYGLAFVRALWRRYALPRMSVTFDGQTREAPILSLTVAIGHREGSFVVAPHAELDDGLFDYLLAGALSRWQVLRFLPKLASGGDLPEGHPQIWQGRCRQVRVTSDQPLTVHVDGEFFCLPADQVQRLEIDILPKRLRVRLLDVEGAG